MLRTRGQVRDLSTETCFCLNFPLKIACRTCEKYVEAGRDRRKKDTCLKPWLQKWGRHRQLAYSEKYCAVRKHLGLFNDGDIFEETCLYTPAKASATDNLFAEKEPWKKCNINENALISWTASTAPKSP